MDILTVILSVFGGVVGFALISGRFKLSSLTKIFGQFLSDVTKEKNIFDEIGVDQEKIETDIDNYEKDHYDTINEIDKVKLEAMREVNNTLSKDNIEDIDEGIDNKWELI